MQTATVSNLQQLGRYQILNVAGRGNTATVYTAYDEVGERNVAVKVYAHDSKSGASPAMMRKLFYNEARTAKVLDHPHILKVLDAGEEDDLLFVVMEYVEGGQTLAKFCDASEMLPVATVAKLVRTCATALDHAHCQQIIHRDIKPSNIMLTPEGMLKLADFGIAEGLCMESTQILGLLGSPLYMAPEQIQDEPVSGPTDLYSLGVVMYQLLTGKPPFFAPSLNELFAQICSTPAPYVCELRTDIPSSLADVVSRALDKDPNQRFQSGAAFASHLDEVIGSLDDQSRRVHALGNILWTETEFFNEFSREERRELLQAGTVKEYTEGEKISLGERPESVFFLILSGNVRLKRGQQSTVSLGPGDCFGEGGFFMPKADSPTLEAITPVQLAAVETSAIEQLSTDCQLKFYRSFLQTLVQRLVRSSHA
ncbi:MAG: protein kinase [Pseudomonadota bacterium]